MDQSKREEIIDELAWRGRWNREVYEKMSDDELIKYKERLDAGH
ncbi:hypothetical protein [Halobacillus sp. BBL2006]|nr:hypothetical protein [Halobacillus sp. BBL2006]